MCYEIRTLVENAEVFDFVPVVSSVARIDPFCVFARFCKHHELHVLAVKQGCLDFLVVDISVTVQENYFINKEFN